MKRHIQPVAKAIGIHKKIGWHTFRHSFGTLLKANGEDVKTVQELLRHANSRITLDVYTQAVNSNKRAAQSGPLSDPDLIVTVGRQLILRSLESMAGTTGLEPATSAVTGQRSDQLSYVPRLFFNNLVICHIESSVSHPSLFSLFSTISLLWTQFWASVDTTWTPRWTPNHDFVDTKMDTKPLSY